MARVFSSGFELQSVGISEKEWDRPFSPNNNFGNISTSIKRSGVASLRLNGDVATPADGFGVAQDTNPPTANHKLWMRAYVLFEAFPSATSSVIGIADDGNFTSSAVMVTPSGTLQYYWLDINSVPTAVSPASASLNLHQWYRLEIFLDTTTPTSWSGEFRLDGTTISSFSGANGGNLPTTIIQLSAGPFSGSVTGIDQYYDDIAANDASGSVHNSWPGDGKIVHLYPNAAGDNNAWLKQGGGAGDANNYQSVSEITPDDATTYLKRTVSGTPTDDYNCQTSASVGLGASDTIRLVQVGVRFGANSNTATSRDAKLRIKGQSGGTVQVGSTVFWNSTIWLTHYKAFPATYSLTSYTNPQSGAAWTPAALDTMQIGMQANTASINEIRVSTIWALVEYVPASAVDHQGSAKLAATASVIVSPIWNANTSAKLDAISALITSASEAVKASAIIQGASDLSIDTLVYRPVSAVLPSTSTLLLNAIPKFVFGGALNPSSTLSVATKQIWSSLALLPANSDLSFNITRQNFATLTSLSCESSLAVDAKLLYKGVPDTFGLASTLRAVGSQRWSAFAAYVLSSDLNVNVTRHYFAATSLLAASTSLQTNTVQSFVGIAVLAPTGVFVTPGGGATLPAAAQFNAVSSLTADTRWIQRAIATLSATITFVTDSQRYIPTSSLFAITSSLSLANSLRYIPASAVLASSSNLAIVAKSLLASLATWDCSTSLICSAIQTVKHIAIAELPGSSSLIAKAFKVFDYRQGVLSPDSGLSVSFTPLLRPASAVLSGDTSLAVPVTSIKERTISASLLGTSILLASASVFWKAQSVHAPAFDLSLFTLQRWSIRPVINPTFDIQIVSAQKMFEKSKWFLTSGCVAETIQFNTARSKISILSDLSVTTDIHQIEHHAKTQKHLKGNLGRKILKGGMAEEADLTAEVA